MAKSDKNANAADVQRFQKALAQIYRQSAKLSFKERLAVLLKIDPNGWALRTATKRRKRSSNSGREKSPNTRNAQTLRGRASRARQAFEHQHLNVQWGEIQKLRAELVNPVRALDTDFKQEARKLLTSRTIGPGPVPEPWTPQQKIDHLTIWALLGIGGLLMIGLASRAAAIAAAVLLLSFYLAIPPWPGVEDLLEAAGPEHSFIVNKNLIEVIALLAIACMPTGQWFGVDRLFGVLVPGKRRTANPAPPSVSTVNKGSAMQLTPEQIQVGSENFNRVSNGLNDSDVSRRDFLKAAAAGTVGLGAAYFGYKKLDGDRVRVGFIGTGDEGNILLTQHPPEYMDIVAVADIRPSNRLRAFVGDGNDDRMGLIRKLGEATASKIKTITITTSSWPTKISRPS